MDEEKDNRPHYIIDMRPKAARPVKELDADLIIEIDLFGDDDYSARYVRREDDNVYFVADSLNSMTRPFMLEQHVLRIRDYKPKSVVIRTGKHSTGHTKDIALHPGVIRSIIEGKLTASELTLRG